jgi:ribosomal protein RSM22 (predicted rRNA methylase)
MMQLPNDLRLALERALRGIAPKQLAAVAAELSTRYREGHARDHATFLRTPQDVTAYAATRMPATWAAVYAALQSTADRQPDWRPRTHLDIGSGPGTAAWAATATWPSLERITLLERDPTMIKLGREFAAQAQSAALRGATWTQADLGGQWQTPAHDLVTLAYVLGELPQTKHAALIERLWSLTGGLLVIIEPGTPRGFELLRAARTQLIAVGAQIVAPCPHAMLCPMANGDWCHFSQRIERTKIHRAIKGAELGYEDEKFSYIAVSRQPAVPAAARVLRHPQNQPGRITLQLCTPAGLQERVVTKRDRGWREARALEWGDEVRPQEEP